MGRSQILAVACGLFGALATHQVTVAQEQSAPMVTVAGFAVDRSARLSNAVLDALIDGLAVQLVESGRYRVLDREWLGVDSDTFKRSPLARIRDQAREADVRYLLTGRITKFSELRRYAAPPTGMRLPFQTPYSTSYPRPYFPMRPQKADYLRVTLELVDVVDGSVLTSATSSCPMPGKTGAGVQRAVDTATQSLMRWRPPATAAR